MSLFERAGLAVLHRLEPERAHDLAHLALRWGASPQGGPVTSDRLRCRLAGLDLPNPVGLAAGFDKNARLVAPLARAGFGFLEVGAVTPLPQPGNPRPRLFRLTRDRGVINRFGFNNDGMETVCARLAAQHAGIPVGLNLGANKDSTDRARDFARVVTHCGAHADFVTVNVSSPNTEGLRDLQGRAALAAILADVVAASRALSVSRPVFLKISPDLDEAGLADVAEVALEGGIAAIVATNTTLARDGLKGMKAGERGGLSGAPLFERSTRQLARLSQLTEGRLPLIGVGGIFTAEDAYAKIRAGATAVQLYTALVYEGLSLASRIARGLDRLLDRDGVASLAEAVGTAREEWS